MASSKNKWASWGAWLYYLVGFSYYVYSWFIIGGGLGFVTGLVGLYFSPIAILWTSVLGISALVLGLGLGVAFSNWRKRYRGINPGLKIMASRTVYTVLPNNEYRYWRELDVIASIDGIDHFTQLFGWTGSGQIFPAASNGHHPDLTDDPTSPKKRLRIYFERPRRKGERFKIEFQMHMTDPGGTARHFLRTTMHEKSRAMTQEVIFEVPDCPPSYKTAIFMSDVGEIPIFEESLLVSRGENSIKWEIKKPRLSYNYCISW